MAASSRPLHVVAATLVAWFAALFVAGIIGRFVPESISLEGDEDILQLQQQFRDKPTITEEDLSRAERLINEKVRAKVRVHSFGESLERLQDRALPLAWIPWAALGLLLVANLRDLAVAGITLLLLAVIGSVSIMACAIYLGACAAGFVAGLFRRRARDAHAP